MKPIKPIEESLYVEIQELLSLGQKTVVREVNRTMIYTYYKIGERIVEFEQKGKTRSPYGKSLLKGISQRLSKEFGRGFSVDNLENMRKFYSVYSKSETVSRKLGMPDFQNADVC